MVKQCFEFSNDLYPKLTSTAALQGNRHNSLSEKSSHVMDEQEEEDEEDDEDDESEEAVDELMEWKVVASAKDNHCP